MNCQELISFLTDYLDGQLPLSQRLAFELHLTLCRDCRSYLHNFKVTVEATKQACANDTPSLPAELPEGLVNAILKARREGQS